MDKIKDKKSGNEKYYPGEGCNCCAYGECECGCGVDWRSYREVELEAMVKWNAGADEYNQWNSLGQDEKDDLIRSQVSKGDKYMDNEPLSCPNPNCGDSGGYPVPDGYGDWEQEQCEFCWTVENSVFNVNRKKAEGENK